MQTIFELKEQAVTDTPLLLFDCVLSDGTTEHWSTHGVSVGGVAYSARVLGHNVFELQASSGQGIDGVPKISLVLGNADSHCSEIERATGWKGARLTAGLVFYDLRNAVPLTDKTVIFQGIWRTSRPAYDRSGGCYRIVVSAEWLLIGVTWMPANVASVFSRTPSRESAAAPNC